VSTRWGAVAVVLMMMMRMEFMIKKERLMDERKYNNTSCAVVVNLM
jgi:hypothetical protein